jgi:hypothetical protein
MQDSAKITLTDLEILVIEALLVENCGTKDRTTL